MPLTFKVNRGNLRLWQTYSHNDVVVKNGRGVCRSRRMFVVAVDDDVAVVEPVWHFILRAVATGALAMLSALVVGFCVVIIAVIGGLS